LAVTGYKDRTIIREPTRIIANQRTFRDLQSSKVYETKGNTREIILMKNKTMSYRFSVFFLISPPFELLGLFSLEVCIGFQFEIFYGSANE